MLGGEDMEDLSTRSSLRSMCWVSFVEFSSIDVSSRVRVNVSTLPSLYLLCRAEVETHVKDHKEDHYLVYRSLVISNNSLSPSPLVGIGLGLGR